jgi:hypothetical protein
MSYSSVPSPGQRTLETPIREVFLEKYLDAFAPSPHRSSDWFRGAAAEARLSSPILYNAFLSVSASYVGSSVGDSRIVLAAQKLYVNVLRELQKALLSPSQSRSQWTLFTVIVAVNYEVACSYHVHRKTQTNLRVIPSCSKILRKGAWLIT